MLTVLTTAEIEVRIGDKLTKMTLKHEGKDKFVSVQVTDGKAMISFELEGENIGNAMKILRLAHVATRKTEQAEKVSS